MSAVDLLRGTISFAVIMSSSLPLSKKETLTAASPPHARHTWPEIGCGTILVHGRLAVMKGTEESTKLPKEKVQKLYDAAKLTNDMDAAHDIVDLMWREAVYEALAERVLQTGMRPIIVSPHPAFDDDDVVDHDAPMRGGPRNAIPFAYAGQLIERLNGIENHVIKQGARVGRTRLPRFPKFLFQPHFVGTVDTERPYIIADDNVGLGGTLAALYSHIAKNGGTVIAVTALAHSTGKDVPFALTTGTLAELNAKYGIEISDLWKEVVGHAPICLTEGEGRFLIEWEGGNGPSAGERLHLLRTRIDRARATFK